MIMDKTQAELKNKIKTFKELSQIFDKSKMNNLKEIEDISFELMAGI